MEKKDLRILIDLAIRGYNAEIHFKSYKRFKDEAASCKAMRVSEEKQVIQDAQKELKEVEIKDEIEK